MMKNRAIGGVFGARGPEGRVAADMREKMVRIADGT